MDTLACLYPTPLSSFLTRTPPFPPSLSPIPQRRFDNGGERVTVPLAVCVGASNELPEDPELDALYDRFLFRRECTPVTDGALPGLLSAFAHEGQAEGQGDGGGGGGSGNDAQGPGAADGTSQLGDFASIAAEAAAGVAVPASVVDLLCRLRSHLAEACEPPIYLSDRRLVKCIKVRPLAVKKTNRPRPPALRSASLPPLHAMLKHDERTCVAHHSLERPHNHTRARSLNHSIAHATPHPSACLLDLWCGLHG